MLNNKLDEECNDHKHRLVKYICFDKKCLEEDLSCVLCILEKHENCEDNLILEKDELNCKLNFKRFSREEKKVVSLIKNKIECSNKKLMSELLILIKSKIKSNDFNFENISKMNLENILKERSSFDINYDEKTKKVIIKELSRKNNKDIDIYNEMVRLFQKKLDKIFNKFENNYKNMNYENIYEFEKKNFILPKENFYFKSKNKKLVFKCLRNKALSFKYKYPLKNLSLKIKIELENIDYIKFGFLIAKDFNEIKNITDFKDKQFLGISYVGSKMKQIGLEGNIINVEILEDFFINIENGKKIFISSINGDYCGSFIKNQEDRDKNLYFCFYITKKNTKVSICKI